MSAASSPFGARALASAPTLVAALAVAHVAWVRATQLRLANHDIGWFLHAGAVWLDGGTIGIDVVDTNPPLVIWLSGLEVALARWLGLTPLATHASVTSALVLGSGLLSCGALRRSPLPALAVAVFRPLLIAASAFAAQYEFGQRDHWVALLLMPWVAWACTRVSGGAGARAARVAAGACAGLAVCLKPHHLGVLVAVEGLRWLETRSLRSILREANLAAAGVMLLYLGSLLWFTPTYFGDLRSTLSVYDAYDMPVPLWSPHSAWLLAALAAGIAFRVARRELVAPLALALAGVFGWIAVWVQRKNFDYHYIPSDLFAFAALALTFGICLAFALGAHPVRRVGVLVALAFVSLAGVEGRLAAPEEVPGREGHRKLIDAHAAGEGILVFSTAVATSFPTLNFSRARSVSPYSCLWPIPGNYTPSERRARPFRYRSWAEMTPIEKNLVSRLVEVLARERPRLLAFDIESEKQGFGGTGFQFRPYLSAQPGFVAIMQEYEPVAVLGRLEYFRRRGE